MSIRYMEGFESVMQASDFQQRGIVPGANTLTATGPARYFGGKAAVRGNNVPNGATSVLSRVIGSMYPSSALSMSAMVYATTFNNSSYFRINTIYHNGTYISINTTNTLRISSTTDLNFWPDPQIINATSGYVAEDIIYDTVRDLYTVCGYAGGGNSAVFATSATLSSTNWTVQAFGTGVSNSSNSRIYQDEATGNLFSTSYQSIQTRVAGATSWTTAYTNTGNTMVGGAAFDGVKWIAPNSNSNTYMTSPNGAVWTASGTVPNSSGSSIAAKPGVGGVPGPIVVGRAQLTPIAYSLDGGLTFVNAAVPNIADANGVKVAYGSNLFVAIPVDGGNSVYFVSEDGVSWSTLPFNHFGANCTSLKYTNGQFIGSFGSAVAYSTNGRNWTWTQCGTYGGSGATFGMVDPFTSSIFQMTFGLAGAATAGITFGGGGSSGFASNNVGDATTFANRWANIQTTLIRNSSTSYTIDYQLDGVPVVSQPITFAQFLSSGARAVPDTAFGPGAYDGVSTSVVPCSTNGILYTKDSGITWTKVTLSSMGSGRRVVWTGAKFIAFGTGVAYSSINGISWTQIAGFPTVTANGADVDIENTTIIVTTQSAGQYVRSVDGGVTWTTHTTLNASYVYVNALFINGTWVAVPTYNASTPSQWGYSTDGLTWEFFSRLAGWDYGASVAGPLFGIVTDSAGTTVRITPQESGPPLIEPSLSPAVGYYGYGYSGGYFVGSVQASNTVAYSQDGINWTTSPNAAPATGTYFTPLRGGSIFRAGSNTSNSAIFFPELQNLPLQLYWNGGSFSSVDDIVITDMESPNSGPQGEVRIMLLPSDVDDQAEWNKVPSTAPTNAYAATRLPVSVTPGSYVEANEVGLKDKYGTSDFTFPTGYRPLAMQVEGFFERVFPNIPTVRLGLEGATTETQTDPIPVSSNVGQTTFVSKLVETNPDGGSWTRANINTTKITVEKTA